MVNNKIKSFIISLCLFPIIAFSQIHGTQHDQLILRGATLINSTGAPPIGPVDIVIEKNKITNVQVVGYPGVEINENRRPKLSKNGIEIDCEGSYVLPGFVDMHGHIGGELKVLIQIMFSSYGWLMVLQQFDNQVEWALKEF